MEKYHISLVGYQAMPIFNGIIYDKPSKIFLIHSEQTIKVAMNIQAAVSIDCELIPVKDANSYFEVFNICTSLFNKYSEKKWSLNAIGGTKIMSLATYDFAKSKKFEIFIIDQNNVVHYFLKYTIKAYLPQIDLKTYFKLAGHNLKSSIEYSEIPIDYFFLQEEIVKFIGIYYSILRSNNKEYKKAKDESIPDKKNNLTIWNSKDKKLTTNFLGNTREYYGTYDYFDIFFNYKWFELLVAKILNNWSGIDKKKIFWNNVISFQNNSGQEKNEIDLIIDTPKKLFFIECKTQVSDFKDIDKFRNGVRNYGGLGAKAFLITNDKPIENIIERCNDNKINVFWLNEAGIPKDVCLLYEMLDKELKQTNPI